MASDTNFRLPCKHHSIDIYIFLWSIMLHDNISYAYCCQHGLDPIRMWNIQLRNMWLQYEAHYCEAKYIHTSIAGRYNTKVYWVQTTWHQLGNSVYDGHHSIILYIDIQLCICIWCSLSVFIQNLKLKGSATTRLMLSLKPLPDHLHKETICELHEIVSFEICSHGICYCWYWYTMLNMTFYKL